MALFPSDSYDIISNKANFTILNQSPTCTISVPSSNIPLTEPANIILNAEASDTGGSIAKVEFYQGTTKLGESTTSPYHFNWTDVKAGSYELIAKAIDNEGAVTTATSLHIKVLTSTAVKLVKSSENGKITLKNDNLTIELADVNNYEISIYNVNGVRVANDEILNNNKTIIPVSTLKAGMYVVAINSNKTQVNKEFIITR